MAEIVLDVKKREKSNKGTKNRMRKSGSIPGVFYSEGKEAVAIEAKELELRPIIFTAENHVVKLKLDDKEASNCIVKDVQFDPLTDRVIHFDLQGLKAGRALQLQVPVILDGTAIGIKDGGVLNQPTNKIDIECLPKHIPEGLHVDISELNIGDSINVGSLSFENIKILTSEDAIVVSVHHQRAAEEVEVPEILEDEDAPAEPEVISKGKSEEEEQE